MTSIARYIRVNTQFEGFHCWPEAPAEVGFLRSLHRHLFKVSVKVSVSHGNRAVEFFIFKGVVDATIRNCLLPILASKSSMSCEDMAETLLALLTADGYCVTEVVVSEDGENEGVAEAVFSHRQ